MKTKVWFIAIMIFAGFSLQAQELNKKMHDTEKDMEILFGHCTFEGLAEVEFGEYAAEYDNYEADPQVISELAGMGYNYSIVIVLGTWCHDSQEQLPRFNRILDEIGYAAGEVSLIAVDGKKTCDLVNLDDLDIEFVPTFIFYRIREEIGRIIETPEVSLEADWLAIIK
jgi:hypothetical protein